MRAETLLPVNDTRSTRVSRNGLIAALDIGSTKVCCFVARVSPQDGIRVVGIGHQVSRGMRGGTVVDIDATELAIRSAVDAAERMAGENVKRVFVNLSCGDPVSHTVGVEVSVSGHEIENADLQHVLHQGMARAEPGEREVVHAIPGSFTIDGTGGVREPRGMVGSRLGVDMHIVTAAIGPLRNAQICVERAMLELEGMVLSGYASGLSSLVNDERDLGVTLLDMGGGTTTVAVFLPTGASCSPMSSQIGGHACDERHRARVSRRLSRMPSGSRRCFGNAPRFSAASDDRETVDVPQVGENASARRHSRIPALGCWFGIIQPRLEEIFEHGSRLRLREFSGLRCDCRPVGSSGIDRRGKSDARACARAGTSTRAWQAGSARPACSA